VKNTFYKILSIVLSLTMIFSVCGIAASADDTSFGENAFFVINGGTGDGTSAASPAPSVYAAVETINKTLGEGDVANIYIMQRNDWNTHTDGVHGMTYWAAKPTDSKIARVPEHKAQIVIQSYDTSVKTYLAFTEKLGQNTSMTLSGPTVFKDITLLSPRYAETGVEADGNDVTFAAGTTYAYYESWSVPSGSGTFDANVKNRYALCAATGIYGETGNVTDDVNIIFENEFKTHTNVDFYKSAIIIDTKGNATYTYEKDVNLTLNNANMAPYIYLGDGHTTAGSTEIKGNFNIDIKAAESVNVLGYNRPFKAGAYQVIISGGADYTGNIAEMSNVTVENGAWYITNESAFADLLSFTDTAGTYNVKSGYVAVATDAFGNKSYSSNGVLTVKSGEYTVDVYVEPITKNYYVKYGGTGNGRSADSPVATVYDAVELVNADKLGKNDIANIYILQDETWNTFNVNDETKVVGKVDGVNTTVPHAMTAWAPNGDAVPSHEARIVIQAYDKDVKTHLAFSANIGENKSLQMAGPTTFKDIVIVCMRKYEQSIYACGNDVVFEDTAAYAYADNDCTSKTPAVWTGKLSYRPIMSMYGGYYNSTHTIDKEVNITYNNAITVTGNNKETLYLDSSYATNTYKEDVTYTFNNAGIIARLRIGNGVQGSSTYEKNLNLYIKSATTVGVQDYNKPVTVKGGYQVIVSGGAKYSGADNNKSGDTWTALSGDISTFTDVTVQGGCWFVTNESNIDDLVRFTSTAGLYAVKSGYTATATNIATGVKTTSENGVLTLAAGSYTVTATKIPAIKDYYVKNGGTGDGRSVNTPAATVADVIPSVNADLTAGDIANVYIIRGDNRATKGVGELVGGEGVKATPEHGFTAWSTDGTVPSYEATLFVQAYDTTETTYLTFSDKLGGNHDMVMGGPTKFDNITIVSVRKTYRQIKVCGNSVTYGPNVKYGKINHGYEDKTAKAWNGTVANSAGMAIYAGSGSAETTQDVNFVFENTYSSSDVNTSFYFTKHTFTKDYNLTVDNENAAPIVYMAAGSGATTIAGDLNINVKNAKSFALMPNSGTLTVGGAINVLVDSNITYSGTVASLTNVTAEKGIWIVKVTADMKNALAATETAGTYTVIDGYTAIATDADGNEYLSNDGVLTLPANGDYEVNIVDYYLNNGETINVYNDIEIDLSTEKHTPKSGKIFIGWTKADGTYASKVATYKRGDVLTAQYADFAADSFVIEETQIRTSGDIGLRFIVNQDKSQIANIPNIQEYGTITLPTDLAGGRELFLDEGVVVTWIWDEENINDFSADKRGETPTKVVAENILEETEQTRKYTLCITGVEEEYDTFYTAKGYIKYLDNNGVTSVIYTSDAQTSIYKLAAEAVAEGVESDVYNSIIETVEAERKAYSDSLTETVKSSYQNSETVSDKFSMLSNGIRLRTLTINTGMDIEQENIGWLSDVHLNYINQRDVEEQVVNALSGYRGRTWLRDGSSINKIISAVEYTNIFEKTVVTGDMVDYLSWGSLSLTNNLIARKSVNNSILMTTGNHEFAESCEPDIKGLPDQLTVEQKYERLQASWSNDATYHEEILYTDSGKANAMLVVLDNGRNSTIYYPGSAEKLQASVNKAKELGIPVLLFQHVPMLTLNPEQPYAYSGGGYDMSLADETNYTNKYDMFSSGSFVNPNSTNEEIKNVCAVIRQNPDVIKGMFNGHFHESMYTEIAATDADGNLLYDENNELVVIPQFTMSATAYGYASKIVIE